MLTCINTFVRDILYALKKKKKKKMEVSSIFHKPLDTVISDGSSFQPPKRRSKYTKHGIKVLPKNESKIRDESYKRDKNEFYANDIVSRNNDRNMKPKIEKVKNKKSIFNKNSKKNQKKYCNKEEDLDSKSTNNYNNEKIYKQNLRSFKENGNSKTLFGHDKINTKADIEYNNKHSESRNSSEKVNLVNIRLKSNKDRTNTYMTETTEDLYETETNENKNSKFVEDDINGAKYAKYNIEELMRKYTEPKSRNNNSMDNKNKFKSNYKNVNNEFKKEKGSGDKNNTILNNNHEKNLKEGCKKAKIDKNIKNMKKIDQEEKNMEKRGHSLQHKKYSKRNNSSKKNISNNSLIIKHGHVNEDHINEHKKRSSINNKDCSYHIDINNDNKIPSTVYLDEDYQSDCFESSSIVTIDSFFQSRIRDNKKSKKEAIMNSSSELSDTDATCDEEAQKIKSLRINKADNSKQKKNMVNNSSNTTDIHITKNKNPRHDAFGTKTKHIQKDSSVDMLINSYLSDSNLIDDCVNNSISKDILSKMKEYLKETEDKI